MRINKLRTFFFNKCDFEEVTSAYKKPEIMDKINVPYNGICSKNKYIKPLSNEWRICVKVIRITAVRRIISIE